MVRSSANLKSCLKGRFTFFVYLKMITWISKLFFFFLSPTHNKHKFRFHLKDTFFHCHSPFSGFSFQSNPHSEDPFWFLETQGSTIDSIYQLLLLSRAPQDSIDTAVFLQVVYFFFCNIRTAETSYIKKDIFHTQP